MGFLAIQCHNADCEVSHGSTSHMGQEASLPFMAPDCIPNLDKCLLESVGWEKVWKNMIWIEIPKFAIGSIKTGHSYSFLLSLLLQPSRAHALDVVTPLPSYSFSPTPAAPAQPMMSFLKSQGEARLHPACWHLFPFTRTSQNTLYNNYLAVSENRIP